MPNTLRKNMKETSCPKKVYRYMSVDELRKVLLGEELNNKTDWEKIAATTSVGFCFLPKAFKGDVYDCVFEELEYMGTSTFEVEDFRSEWNNIAMCHFRDDREASELPVWEDEMSGHELKSFQKDFRAYVRNHVLVEFINNGQDFKCTLGNYRKFFGIKEYSTTSYSRETLCPVRFSWLSAKTLKWHSIAKFNA